MKAAVGAPLAGGGGGDAAAGSTYSRWLFAVLDAVTIPFVVAAYSASRTACGDAPRVQVEPQVVDGQFVIKRELLPDGRAKLILRDPATGDFSERVQP